MWLLNSCEDIPCLTQFIIEWVLYKYWLVIEERLQNYCSLSS